MTLEFTKYKDFESTGVVKLYVVNSQEAVWMSSDERFLISLKRGTRLSWASLNVSRYDLAAVYFLEEGKVYSGWSKLIPCERDGSIAYVVKELMDVIKASKGTVSEFRIPADVRCLVDKFRPKHGPVTLQTFQAYKDGIFQGESCP